MPKHKIRPMKQPDKIINYWIREKLIVACIVVFGLAFNITIVLGPVFQGRLIDAVAADGDAAAVLLQSFQFVAIIAMVQLLRCIKRFYIRRFANSTSAVMRLMIYNNIMHRSASELHEESSGNLMTRAVSDVELCVEGMRKFTTEIFDTGVLMVSYLLSLMIFDVKITLISILFVPVAMVLAEKLKSTIYKYSVEFRQKSSEIAEITYDAIENSMLYRVNGMEPQNTQKYKVELEDLQKKVVKANMLENSMQPMYHAIAMIGVSLVIYFGGLKVLDGSWTIGLFSAFLTMFIALAVKASKAAKLFNSVQKSQISWKRIKPYLSEYTKKEAYEINAEESTCLKVKDLAFNYGTDRENILEGVHFEGKQGEMIGITGSIASGKSTLGVTIFIESFPSPLPKIPSKNL